MRNFFSKAITSRRAVGWSEKGQKHLLYFILLLSDPTIREKKLLKNLFAAGFYSVEQNSTHGFGTTCCQWHFCCQSRIIWRMAKELPYCKLSTAYCKSCYVFIAEIQCSRGFEGIVPAIISKYFSALKFSCRSSNCCIILFQLIFLLWVLFEAKCVLVHLPVSPTSFQREQNENLSENFVNVYFKLFKQEYTFHVHSVKVQEISLFQTMIAHTPLWNTVLIASRQQCVWRLTREGADFCWVYWAKLSKPSSQDVP